MKIRGTAAPSHVTVHFVFRLVYCFILISKVAWKRWIGSVSSLPKTSCIKLNIKHLFGFAEKHCKWRKSRAVSACRTNVALAKYWKGCGLPIKNSNLVLRAGAVFTTAQGWQVQWPVMGSRMTSFVLVVVRDSVLGSEALQFTVIRHILWSLISCSDYIWHVFLY